MKNVTNTYGYYLTEDSDTIELQGNFTKNFIYFDTKDPKEQLNYKLFVSPKKAVNFGIQIVGGQNPNTVYIPQHLYKDLEVAYVENNPYYTIKDLTIIKLNFTSSGTNLIKYLKQKYENTEGGQKSKMDLAGVTNITNYACLDSSGNPNDEEIIKQILYLFDEQNDIIFVNKTDELVTESIVKTRSYGSNRIKGDFTYKSNYFDASGKFAEGALNSKSNIKNEQTTSTSISSLNDFVKDFAGQSLESVNDIYKSNIVKEIQANVAPKVFGLVMGGLGQVIPLVKSTLDKNKQKQAQADVKKAKELLDNPPTLPTADAIQVPKIGTIGMITPRFPDKVNLPPENSNKNPNDKLSGAKSFSEQAKKAQDSVEEKKKQMQKLQDRMDESIKKAEAAGKKIAQLKTISTTGVTMDEANQMLNNFGNATTDSLRSGLNQ